MGDKTKFSDEAARELARNFRLLSDQTRLRIVVQLARGPLSVTALAGALSLPQHTVSHHLGILRMGGLADSRRDGKQVIYSVRRKVLETLGRRLINHLGGNLAQQEDG